MHAGEERRAPFRVRDDARLAAELAYVVPLGIPHSRFLSWSEDDQDKALAWRSLQSQRCSGCGTRADEWDPALGGDRHAYVADLSRCPGCEALDQARRDAPEHELGLRIGLVRNEGPDDEDEE